VVLERRISESTFSMFKCAGKNLNEINSINHTFHFHTSFSFPLDFCRSLPLLFVEVHMPFFHSTFAHLFSFLQEYILLAILMLVLTLTFTAVVVL
jgi:hypothetical protein